MEYFAILLPLSLILLLSKCLSKICSRIGLPQVVGMLLTGVLLGLIKYIPGQEIITSATLEGLGFLSKIGVVLIMFSAGLETDIKQIKSVGIPSLVITCAGVLVPMGLGFVVACAFNGGFDVGTDQLLKNLFYGAILTATSVSVTVATLRELGKISSKVGSTIIAAAVLDDIIGIIVLSFVIALNGGDGAAQSVPLWLMIVRTLLFFVFISVLGYVCNKLFQLLDKHFPHHRLIPIFSLSLCFFAAYASEAWFGVADITGAFAAGLFLSKNPEVGYIDRKSDVISYMIFSPVFFANIGITSSFNFTDPNFVLFGLCFVAAGIIGKFAGCFGTSLMCGYSAKDSCRVGLGMMVRAEVALVCCQKGVDAGIIGTEIMPFLVLLIIVTSFITPVLLKASYKNDPLETVPVK